MTYEKAESIAKDKFYLIIVYKTYYKLAKLRNCNHLQINIWFISVPLISKNFYFAHYYSDKTFCYSGLRDLCSSRFDHCIDPDVLSVMCEIVNNFLYLAIHEKSLKSIYLVEKVLIICIS